MSDSFVSYAAVLSMLLEVSGSPKPGNIGRFHNFSDTSYEHFLASAASMPFIFSNAYHCRDRVGELIYNAVSSSLSKRFGGNTHFGTLILLIPLCMGAGIAFSQVSFPFEENFFLSKKAFRLKKEVCKSAYSICKNTTFLDALRFYEAFEHSSAFVHKIDNTSRASDISAASFDLNSKSTLTEIRESKTSLYTLMEMAQQRDLIAHEWCFGFTRCLRFSEHMDSFFDFYSKNLSFCYGSPVNSAIAASFICSLAETPDSLIASRHGVCVAEEVCASFKSLLKDSGFYKNQDLKSLQPEINKIDRTMIQRKLNPGSLADIASAGIFLSLLGGLKF